MTNSLPVLIVGAGPVGLALAGDLGWRGVPCMLIERTDGAIEQPKMDLVGVRTLEFCRRWGIAMSGTAALTYTTNVLFRCADFPSLHDKGKGYRFIFIGPEGTWLTVVAVNGGDRFRMSIVGSPDKVTHGEADIRAALRRAMGRDFDYEILSVMRWVRRELVADRYGSERVFIAGDAAHLTSPTGALGMNTGIQDVVDLGWNLEAVLRGWGGPALLRSYEVER